ncbi:uncharacterized protein B0H18DRAFT_959872 [Fomitopsis serialis]|uniref:uncharacterized protein n=1 Tax=Fomitopsis serialis TaxID=139415 RepID=UPI002008DB2F|nr:uncharacterized protein B0H18DRAFT_959872 [Neoantrodia serialis]KAH9914412.1 hypothetical protein B0H18DRAFT_959872 [Neoantrodia serialis]
MRVLAYNRFTRRDCFVLAAALSFGLGDILMSDFLTYLFAGMRTNNKGLQGFLDSITIVLSTPFLITGLITVLLNLILPQEDDQNGDDNDVIERGIEREVVHVEAAERGHDEKTI